MKTAGPLRAIALAGACAAAADFVNLDFEQATGPATVTLLGVGVVTLVAFVRRTGSTRQRLTERS